AGTEAAVLRDDVPPPVKAARRARLLQMERELAAAYHRELLGRTLDVLVEGADPSRPGFARGTSCRYAPVSFPGHAPPLLRRRVRGRGTAVEGDGIVGEPTVGTSCQLVLSEMGQAGSLSLRAGRIPLPLLAERCP